MKHIGKLESVNPREVWQDETAFSDWLADNLSILGKELGMELERSEREKQVGAFSADIICHDRLSERGVVIENQFTRSDHDHLGKVITYASGLRSSIVIWISPCFRDEHRESIGWLNNVTGAETEFFGVIIEMWKIGHSEYAPRFNVIAKPDAWQGQLVATPKTGRKTPFSDHEIRMAHFWNDVRAFFVSRSSEVEPGNSRHGDWLHFKLPETANYIRAIFEGHAATFRVEAILYGLKRSPEYSHLWYEYMHAHKNEIEDVMGETLIWEKPAKNVEVSISLEPEPADIGDPAIRADIIERIFDKVHRFNSAFRPHLAAFVAKHGPL